MISIDILGKFVNCCIWGDRWEESMNLQTDNICKIYFKYLVPSLFSGLVMSIYSLVDMIVVGQYEGAAGTAALACVAPLWAFFCCLSTLFGNGGAVLFSRAKGEGRREESRTAFTISFLLLCSATAVVWFVIAVFDESLLRLLGADESLLPLALRYMKWLKLGIPLWPVGYFMGMFVRNDGSPALVGAATVCGGVLNVFGDIFLTFYCDMGIEGAAIATVAGQGVVFLIQLLHLFTRKNTIAFTRVTAFWRRGMEIASVGVPSFLCSVGMGFVVVLFNNQIMRYFGSNELAVYGVAGNLFTLIQTFSYGIGNAAQPIVAENMGAGKLERVRQTRTMGCCIAAGIGLGTMVVALLLPLQIVQLYMRASTEIQAAAPGILRRYFTCLLFVPFNVYATYYLQAVQRVKESLAVSLLHSFLLGAAFVYLFPAVFGGGAIWYVMLFAEMITAGVAVVLFWKRDIKRPSACQQG